MIFGCANQAGEDNRNVARMALLLAGLPKEVPGATVNRLCGSSMDAAGIAARAISSGETDLMIAGGVESMTRAPFVTAKSDAAFSRTSETFDTTIGWRFVNPAMKCKYGVDSMPETAENVAEEFHVGRADQDAFAYRTQQRWARAHAAGFFKNEIVPVADPAKKRRPENVRHRRTSPARHDSRRSRQTQTHRQTQWHSNRRQRLRHQRRLLRSAPGLRSRSEKIRLTPRARLLATTTVGVAPRIMGFAPAPATKKILQKTGLQLSQIDVIELNEAFAAQALAVTRDLGLPDDAEHVNPNGGAIAIGHPLGASGARLITTAMYQLQDTKRRYALCTMCIGVGQGIATIIERMLNRTVVRRVSSALSVRIVVAAHFRPSMLRDKSLRGVDCGLWLESRKNSGFRRGGMLLCSCFLCELCARTSAPSALNLLLLLLLLLLVPLCPPLLLSVLCVKSFAPA